MATNCYSLVLSFTSGAQFSSSIWHYQFDDSGYVSSQAAAAALCAAWDSANKTALKACLPTGTTLKSYKSRRVNLPGGFEAILQVTSAGGGTRTGQAMVSGVNPLVVFLPISNDKRRGKWFIPAVSPADLIDGQYTSAYFTAIETQLLTLKGALTLAGGGTPLASQVIYSRRSNTWIALHASYLSTTVGTQRRRQRPV